jgi:hypothetical protein
MIAVPDLINGCLEAAMGYAGWQNLKAIRRDKSVKGVHWYTTAVAGLWGFYNLFYYPHLGQYFSFFAGIGICAINSTWLYFAYKYGTFKKSKITPQPLMPVSGGKQWI